MWSWQDDAAAGLLVTRAYIHKKTSMLMYMDVDDFC